MPIFDYSCTCGEFKADELVRNHNDVVVCDCGQEMERALCAPKLIGFDKFGTSKKATK